MKNRLNTKEITTDVLIIGGGTAGCYAALVLSEQKAGRVLIAEKANIKRSGCLAAGVNAINAYIVKGRKPQDYVDYATKDAAGIVRQDLLLTAAENFNEVTAKMEKLGLVILKDENGDYVARGNRNRRSGLRSRWFFYYGRNRLRYPGKSSSCCNRRSGWTL